jgi:hypothetical protein
MGLALCSKATRDQALVCIQICIKMDVIFKKEEYALRCGKIG